MIKMRTIHWHILYNPDNMKYAIFDKFYYIRFRISLKDALQWIQSNSHVKNVLISNNVRDRPSNRTLMAFKAFHIKVLFGGDTLDALERQIKDHKKKINKEFKVMYKENMQYRKGFNKV